MSLSMYTASVPVFRQVLGSLSAILEKAESHADLKKIEPDALLKARLFPDMFPLLRQVQIACDFAKGGVGRLGGVELPSYADDETNIDQLLARIEKTLAFIASVPADAVANSEERDIELKLGGQQMQFKGLPYLLNMVLPNFYFHYSMTYAILRHNGVELGKTDYIGSLT
jgi:hypothetical protein